ncbi:MAG: Ger(x)C family spore germination protein [Syntrophomonadaceae bacterium]|nr:Ger(x)C family spore germination protein [Syntrophomonadaceae bacterium]
MQSDKTKTILPLNKCKTFCLLTLLILSMFITSGCWDKLEVNEAAQVEGMVFDLSAGQPSFSIQLAAPSSNNLSGTPSTEPLNISETGRTYTEAARHIILRLPRLPLWSHAEVVILGNDLASNDLAYAMDFIARNRNIRKSAVVFVSKGATGKECLEAQVPLETHSSAALKKLITIQEQQLGAYTPVTMDDFLKYLSTSGIEPVAPQISIEEVEGKKQLRLDGTAVFRGRKMVGALNETESQGFRFLSPKQISGGLIVIPSPLDQASDNNSSNMISIELTRSQAKVSPEIGNDGSIRVKIDIQAEGNFYEQTFTGNVLTLEGINKIQTLVDDSIKSEVQACIMKAQILNSDIFGWGRSVYRKDPALWTQLEANWPDIFPVIQADINVDFQLRRTYLLDQSFEFKD